MSIQFVAEGVKKPKLRYRLISNVIEQIVNKFGCYTGKVTYILCTDDYLRAINLEFLKHDYYTDVITFDYCEGKVISGDIFISVERVRENSELFLAIFDDEFLRVIFHGLLHLLGFKDKTDSEEKIMRGAEDECIYAFNKNCNECSK
jgi:probable rRNA maturation factor